MKKLGLCLGAGGSRGVAHIGFLQALEEAGVRPQYVTGCSMGAIVGACYCGGVSPKEMKEAVIGLKMTDLATINVPLLRGSGLMKMTRARKLLADLMGEKDFSELEIPFACVATDLSTGKTVVLDRGSVLDAAIASGTIPGAFVPSSACGHELLVDGGLLERVPAKQLKKMGAEVIVAVDVLGDLPKEKEVKGSIIDILLRCIDIMDTQTTMYKRRSRRYVDLWLEPTLGGMDQYQVKDLKFAYDKGYELGAENRGRIKELIQ